MINSQYAYAAALRAAVTSARCWLDLGCGHAFLPAWLPEVERTIDVRGCFVAGIDLDVQALRRHQSLRGRVLADIEALPFVASSFDLVTANMVLEHVSDPRRLFQEVRRVVEPGGRFLIHTPNLYGYTTALSRLVPQRWRRALACWLQNRAACDVYPTRYRANTARALEGAAASTGFSIDEFRYVLSSPQLLAIPPLAVCELGLIKALRHVRLASLRPCLIVALRAV